MKLTRIHKLFRHDPQVKALYQSACPAYERLPLWVLHLMSLRKGANFYAAYHEASSESSANTLAGIVYALVKDEIIFVLYLACPPGKQQQENASAILDQLCILYPNHTLAMNVLPNFDTPTHPKCAGLGKDFYLKYGILDTGHEILENEEKYILLAQDKEIDPQRITKLLTHFTIGFDKVNILK